jgi:uncharacterized membrane protein
LNRGRLEAFSDGVLAVAITLLALNLVVDGPGHGPLLRQLGQHWPSFVAYLVSFFVIGIVWVNHHTLVQNVTSVDRTLLFLNLVFLLFVVLIPFATATMAQYLLTGGQDAHVAMALYGTILECMGLSFAAMFGWMLRQTGAYGSMPRQVRRAIWTRFSVGSLVYLVAIAVALVSALAALAIIGLVALYYIFEQTPTAGSQPSRE